MRGQKRKYQLAGSRKFSAGNVIHRQGFYLQGWERKAVLSGEKTGWRYSGRSENNGTYPPEELEELGKTWDGAQEVEEGVL